MREIKFRSWVENDRIKNNIYPFMNYGVEFMGGAINDIFATSGQAPLNPYGNKITYMQFTGLKDKNGREIYEGDVIRFTNGIDEVYEEVGTVVFDLEECGYKAQYIDDGVKRCIYLINPKVFADKYTEITYEIIGNIYENPELLEVAE